MRGLIPAVACHVLLGCCLAGAQESGGPNAPEPAKAPAEQPAPSSTRQFQEIAPPLYYLKDRDGNLQAVPGFSFDAFVELYKLKNDLQQRQQKPRYSLQRMSASGTAGQEHAELTIQLAILVEESDWVRVPLRLDQGVLCEPVRYDGKGEQFVHFEESGEGYVCWIRGQPGEQHQITLKMLVPLSDVADGARLKLHVPRATSSELKLKVPLAQAAAKVSEGATLLPPASAGKDATELAVFGLGGEFELTWRAADAQTAEAPAVLEVVGALLARLDHRDVVTNATLTVRSYGEPFDRFQVRLPKGAELVSGSPSGYTVTLVEGSPAAASEERVAEVRLGKKTSGPVDVQLSTKRPHEAAKANDWLELNGFEVVEAARQWGHVGVAVVGDWHVLWGPSRGVRQVDQWPEALRYEDVVAGFEYFAQPYSLSARLVARKTHVSVEPEYLLLVDAEQVRLEAKLKYTIRGAKVFVLDVKLPEWEFDQVEPEYLVAMDGVAVDQSQVLSIPLLQPSTGQAELVIRAHRPIPAGTKSLVVPLPQPRANSQGPATVVVVPADNVELTPDTEAIAGLSRQQIAPQMQLPERQQDPLFYRGEAAKAVFACGFRVHPQTVTVDVTSQLSLDPKACQVEQKLAYRIAYEPLDGLKIEVPQSLAAADGLSIQLEGQTLTPALTSGKDDQKSASTSARMWVALPKPYLGSCELTVRYPLRCPELAAGQTTAFCVPLVMPGEGKLLGNKLSVAAAAGITVRPSEGPWTPAEGEAPPPGPRRALQLTAAKPADQAVLSVELEDTHAQGPMVLERAWVQTWLTQSARQDRAVFRFTSDQKELELILPDGAVQAQTLALLDGKPIVPQAAGGGRLVIPLSGNESQRPHVLELRYHFPEGRPARGSLSLALPELGRDTWIRRIYWQLVLPQDEHVVVSPAGFNAEFTWGWNEYFWGRKPILEQPELETWIGAAHQTPVPERANRYLFSGLGRIDRCQLRTASRSWIVLVASGAALVAGLVLIYVPASRHPGSLFTLAMLLLCVGVLYPEPTLLASQAASLGLGLTLIAGLLQRSVARRRRATTFREASHLLLEKGSTQSLHPSLAADNQAPTGSSPTAAPPATLDWNV